MMVPKPSLYTAVICTQPMDCESIYALTLRPRLACIAMLRAHFLAQCDGESGRGHALAARTDGQSNCPKRKQAGPISRRVVSRVLLLYCTANGAPRNFPIPWSARSRAARSYELATPNLVENLLYFALQPCSNAPGLDPVYCTTMVCMVCLWGSVLEACEDRIVK
jgi:hypothetical protein